MKHFAHLIESLDQTTKTNAKVDHLVDFFAAADDPDKVWAIALFSGKRPKRTVSSTLLRQWAAEASGFPAWLFEESYHVVGDLAETVALFLPPPTDSTETRTLSEWMDLLQSLAGVEEADKEQAILAAWRSLSTQERFVFNKLITGGFRIGVSQKLMVKALARHTGQPENVVSHRLMGNWKPQTIQFHDLLFGQDAGDDLSRPYPFFLAYPLENTPDTLGNPADWQAEWKWDGIRSQLIFRENTLFLWSRGEELITPKFPELETLAASLPARTVIDGELLPFKNGSPLSFQVLQTRIGRKNVTKKILADCPVVIMAYDLLEWQGKDLRELPLQERRAILAELVLTVGQSDLLRLSPEVTFNDWDQLADLRSQARDHLAEGLMLKRRSSAYQVGRKKGDWWKWKVDPLSVDAVMIYAQRGHGRRANLFSDYTFAVWDEDQLVPFAKAYSGLTDAEMQQVDAWIKRNTVDKFGPVRRVIPELVFEIGFEGIAYSPRHKSGIAVRFPRMLRWRTDKKAKDADHIQALRELLGSEIPP